MILAAIFIGIIATAVTDLIALARARLFGVKGLNYAMVGRWLGHLFASGQLRHRAIAHSPKRPHEALIGWSAHYVIGVIFAFIFLRFWPQGVSPLDNLLYALFFGAFTVIAPFFILQPGMGAGIAASRLPAPWQARKNSLISHLSFGLGLWLANQIWHGLPL